MKVLPKWNQRNHTIPSHSHRRPTEAEKGAGLDPIHCVSWFGPLKYSVQIYIYIYIHTYLRRGERKPASHLSLCSPILFTQRLFTQKLLLHRLFTQKLFTQKLLLQILFIHIFSPIDSSPRNSSCTYIYIYIYTYIYIYIVFLTPGTKRLSPRPLRPILREMHHP